MKVLTVAGEDGDGNLQQFHIVNPTNVVVHKGVLSKPGTMQDGEGNPIPVEVERTFVRVGGQPLFSMEAVDVIVKRAKEL